MWTRKKFCRLERHACFGAIGLRRGYRTVSPQDLGLCNISYEMHQFLQYFNQVHITLTNSELVICLTQR
jgi:hypothetical protein